MSERSKLTSSHLRRQAFVYLRQSSQAQLERNVESTDRQYQLVARAIELGFAREQVVVVDEDLGISGSGLSERSGFARLTAEVALGHAGLVLGLEVSRLARNNADWYRLLDLCGVTDTVIGDADGIYHPGSFNDRLLLGLKGTMSEAELHVLRARLEGGIRNKAARGELRKALPVGLVWGEDEGEILLDADEAVRGAIATIFERFAELGSVRQVWLWMRREQLRFPMRRFAHGETEWIVPTYHQIHSVLESPVYAGAYAFGKTRRERYVDEHGNTRQRMRRLPQAEWGVLIWEHHPGYIDKATFEANRARIAANTRPRAHQAGGAVRDGQALLQGIAVCGRCGRKLKVHYQGRRGHQSPAYHCPSSILVEGRGSWCLRVGGGQIDQAVAGALLAALTPRRRQGRAASRRSARTGSRRRAGPVAAAGRARPLPGPARRTPLPPGRAPSTASSPAAWNATGRRRSARSLTPKPSWRCASNNARAPSPTLSASSCSRSAQTSAGCGPRPQPPTATASNSSAP